MTFLISLLKNPTVLVGIFAGAIILYLYVSNVNLEATVAKRDSTITTLRSNIDTLNSNMTICTSTNSSNSDVIKTVKKDITELKKYYDGKIKFKDTLILTLRGEILELSKPIEYTETVIYKECKLDFKLKDNDENSTFNILRNIGN